MHRDDARKRRQVAPPTPAHGGAPGPAPAPAAKAARRGGKASATEQPPDAASGPTPPEDFNGELGDAAELRRLEEALAGHELNPFVGHNGVTPFKPHSRIWHGFFGVRYLPPKEGRQGKWRVKVRGVGKELPGRPLTLVAAATALANYLKVEVARVGAAALLPQACSKAGGSSGPSSGPSRQPNAGGGAGAAARSAQQNCRPPGKRPATASSYSGRGAGVALLGVDEVAGGREPKEPRVEREFNKEKEKEKELAQRQRKLEEAEADLQRQQAKVDQRCREVDERDRARRQAAAELETAQQAAAAAAAAELEAAETAQAEAAKKSKEAAAAAAAAVAAAEAAKAEGAGRRAGDVLETCQLNCACCLCDFEVNNLQLGACPVCMWAISGLHESFTMKSFIEKFKGAPTGREGSRPVPDGAVVVHPLDDCYRIRRGLEIACNRQRPPALTKTVLEPVDAATRAARWAASKARQG